MLVLLYCPCPSVEVAQNLARSLLEKRLVACCNVVPQMASFYTWEGESMQEGETLLLAKTTPAREAAAMQHLADTHPYDIPAICSLPIKTTQPYADWVAGEVA